MSRGRFGIHGGQFIPETLMSAVTELEEAYEYKTCRKTEQNITFCPSVNLD